MMQKIARIQTEELCSCAFSNETRRTLIRNVLTIAWLLHSFHGKMHLDSWSLTNKNKSKNDLTLTTVTSMQFTRNEKKMHPIFIDYCEKIEMLFIFASIIFEVLFILSNKFEYKCLFLFIFFILIQFNCW